MENYENNQPPSEENIFFYLSGQVTENNKTFNIYHLPGIYESKYTMYTKLEFNITSIEGTGDVYINQYDESSVDAYGNYTQQIDSKIELDEVEPTKITFESNYLETATKFRIKVESGTQITFSSIGVTYYDADDADGNQNEYYFFDLEPLNNGYEETLDTTLSF